MKKQINNIFMILLILILIVSSFLLRKSQYFYMVRIAILLIFIVYLLIRNIYKEPIKIIKNKLDIMILVLVCTAFVPLIFGTYASLKATVITGLNYISLYFLYILAREIFSRNIIEIKHINTAIIAQAVMFIIIGIENLTTNKILTFLEIENIINGEARLVSLFGNPNVLASYLLFAFFIALHRTINAQKINEKIVLNICNTVCTIGIILTYSKAIWVLMPIMLFVYMILNRNKEKNIEIIQNIITYVLTAVIYLIIYNKLMSIESYIFVWIFLLLTIIIEILINIINIKIKEKVEKIKIRYVIIAILLIMICSVTWIIMELEEAIPYNIFNNNNTSTYEAKKIYNIEGETLYKLSFDIEAEAFTQDNENIEDMYEINVIERDAKNLEIKNTEIKFGNYTGIKEIEILTHQNTRELKIEFKAKYQYISRKLIIKELKLNDKIIPLQYKNLPTKLIDKIKNININYKTAQERIQFIKDAIELSKENLLVGIGGQGWQYRYGEVQEYDYTSLDIHSYPIQILLEFGLVGFVSLMAIYIYIISMKTEPKYLGLKIGLIAVMIHSAMDSEMKILYMQMLMFIYFAIFSTQKEEYSIQRKKLAICSNICYVTIAIGAIYLILNDSTSALEKEISELTKSNIGIEIEADEYIENNKKIAQIYEKIMKYEKNREQDYYLKFLTSYIKSGQTEKIEEYYLKIKEYENKWKQKPSKIIEKSNLIINIIELLEKQENTQLYEWIAKFAKILLDENDKTQKELEEAINKKYQTKEESVEYITYQMNIKNIEEIYEKYVLGVKIINKSDKDIKKEIIEEEIEIDNKNILVYHTHGTEAYYAQGQYEETEDSKTLNEKYNVLAIGDTLQEKLEENGIKVTHLKDYNDINGVNGAYDSARIKVEEQLTKENAEIIFDIHRDAYQGGFNTNNSIEIDGQKVANIRFVIASGHENWKENLKWAVAIQKEADKMYPGLFKPILIYNNDYNQSISKYATLIEVGNNANTVEEANKSMEYFANILKKLL